jgi:ATP-dependent helicase/nuclease subunit B
MLSQIPSAVPKPPDDRVIDIQGWLELFFEPGMHLMLCGMNEGRVPAAISNDPWLGENARQWLGLITANQRAARDAFLFHSMIEARRRNGRVDILFAKSGARGEALLPSRFLLNTTPEELPQRVKNLFAEIQPPESSLAWSRDWTWQAPLQAPRQKIGATAIRTYISCPFRFYLKHMCGMNAMEPERKEWNARDFGTIPHDILQAFGKDAVAKESTDPAFISDWFSSRLDEVVTRLHGKSPALAIRIQTEAIRQRLHWAAQIQAEQREMGWQITDVEIPVKIQLGDFTISAQIDRIDQHEKSGDLRVVDYKTGKVSPVRQAHVKKEKTERERPAHLAADDCPLYFTIQGKTKPELHRWVDLQLPLYAQAVMETRKMLAYPAYFHLGATQKDVCVSEWNDFSNEDLDSAMKSAKWITDQIQASIFWPPAEKPTYDDFAILSCGKQLVDVCEMP